jgi:DNA-binding XRE family transcriptional regulator
VADDDQANLLRAVGKRVREARDAAGLSQAQLAKRIGVTRPSVANLEAGRQDMNITRIAGILVALGLDLGSLIQPGDLPELPPLPPPPHQVTIRTVLEVSCATCGGVVLDVTANRDLARETKNGHVAEMLAKAEADRG